MSARSLGVPFLLFRRTTGKSSTILHSVLFYRITTQSFVSHARILHSRTVVSNAFFALLTTVFARSYFMPMCRLASGRMHSLLPHCSLTFVHVVHVGTSHHNTSSLVRHHSMMVCVFLCAFVILALPTLPLTNLHLVQFHVSFSAILLTPRVIGATIPSPTVYSLPGMFTLMATGSRFSSYPRFLQWRMSPPRRLSQGVPAPLSPRPLV